MDDAAISPRLRAISERTDRFVEIMLPITNVLWWLYLLGLGVLACINLAHMSWDDVKFAAIVSVVVWVAYYVALLVLLGATHLWRLALLFGMVGGFAGQIVGCLIGVAIAGLIGVVVLVVETHPLREAARRRRLVRGAS